MSKTNDCEVDAAEVTEHNECEKISLTRFLNHGMKDLDKVLVVV
jgi:hypothetical protein